MSTTEHDDEPVTDDPTHAEAEPGEEEEPRRLEAMRRMPTRAQLEAMTERRRSSGAEIEDSDEVDEYYRRLAERITPTRARLDVLIDKCGLSDINYAEEDDELPC